MLTGKSKRSRLDPLKSKHVIATSQKGDLELHVDYLYQQQVLQQV